MMSPFALLVAHVLAGGQVGAGNCCYDSLQCAIQSNPKASSQLSRPALAAILHQHLDVALATQMAARDAAPSPNGI